MPVLGMAAGVFVVLMAVARRYGWHRDELYFLEAGRHLAWGYVDQPPFTPLVARLADLVAPGNLVVLRLLPALAIAGTVVLGAAIAREFGGPSRGQAAAAGAVAAGGFALGVGHLLATATFDFTAWLALLWITARLLHTDDARWWTAFGAVAGASMLNKNLLFLLVASLVVGLAIERRWPLVRSPWLAAGVGIALVIAAPNLLWQATHGWPQVEMARVLSRRLAAEDRLTLLPLQVLLVGPAFVFVVVEGVRWLLRDTGARAFRPLLWAWPAGLAITFLTGGRPYYPVPLTVVVMIAGVVSRTHRRGASGLVWLIVPNALISIPLALPVLPVSTVGALGTTNEAVAETIGWPEMVDEVASVVHQLPPSEQSNMILLAATYGEAGALDRFGPGRGLPPAYSPHNSYATFRKPADSRATVVAIRFSESYLLRYFRSCRRAGAVDNRVHVANEVRGTPIEVCRDLREPWPETWARMRFLS